MFSERYGYDPRKEVVFEDVTPNIRNRVWNLFYHEEIAPEILVNHNFHRYNTETKPLENAILDQFGIVVDSATRGIIAQERLKKFLTKECEWYQIYDFIELHLLHSETDKRDFYSDKYNMMLESEKSGYRVLNLQVVPITNTHELQEIASAISTPYPAPNKHLEKALKLYADRNEPDYENSVKESISAVEAMCCVITGSTGGNSTLNAAIKRLKDKGVHIHPCMEKAFISLYGYASDEHGIRHGGIDFKNVPAEDAKFMLVSCSTFINYLLEKMSKNNRI